MIKNSTLGVLVDKNKVFYYLETNNISSQTNVARLLNTLMARGLVKFVFDDPEYKASTFSVISYGKAVSAGYEKEAIYMTKHVKSTSENQAGNEATEQVNPWNKK